MDAAVALLIEIINQSVAVSAIIAKMRAEGRDKLTPDEWQQILDRDDVSRAAQRAALEHATRD